MKISKKVRPRIQAKAMQETGEHDVASIARVLGVSRASVYRVLATAARDLA